MSTIRRLRRDMVRAMTDPTNPTIKVTPEQFVQLALLDNAGGHLQGTMNQLNNLGFGETARVLGEAIGALNLAKAKMLRGWQTNLVVAPAGTTVNGAKVG